MIWQICKLTSIPETQMDLFRPCLQCVRLGPSSYKPIVPPHNLLRLKTIKDLFFRIKHLETWVDAESWLLGGGLAGGRQRRFFGHTKEPPHWNQGNAAHTFVSLCVLLYKLSIGVGPNQARIAARPCVRGSDCERLYYRASQVSNVFSSDEL